MAAEKGNTMNVIETIKQWNECRLPDELFLECLKELKMYDEYKNIFLCGSNEKSGSF